MSQPVNVTGVGHCEIWAVPEGESATLFQAKSAIAGPRVMLANKGTFERTDAPRIDLGEMFKIEGHPGIFRIDAEPNPRGRSFAAAIVEAAA
jgi:hypothetical protein